MLSPTCCTPEDLCFSEFNCSLLDRIQLETTPMHSKSFTGNASISMGHQELYTWVSSAYRCGEKPLSLINDIRSAVYKMNNMVNNTDPWGTPHVRRTFDYLRSLCSTYCAWPSRYDWNHQCTVSWMPKVTCRHWSRISWSTMSNAADRSRRTSAAELPRSRACSMSDNTCKAAVSVEWPGRKPYCSGGRRSADIK